mgnify:CR=1 FL=1
MFGIDSKLYEFLSKIADLIIVNLLFIICSLPIVTIGASTTALYGVTKKWQVTVKATYLGHTLNCSRKISNNQQ